MGAHVGPEVGLDEARFAVADVLDQPSQGSCIVLGLDPLDAQMHVIDDGGLLVPHDVVARVVVAVGRDGEGEDAQLGEVDLVLMPGLACGILNGAGLGGGGCWTGLVRRFRGKGLTFGEDGSDEWYRQLPVPVHGHVHATDFLGGSRVLGDYDADPAGIVRPNVIYKGFCDAEPVDDIPWSPSEEQAWAIEAHCSDQRTKVEHIFPVQYIETFITTLSANT